MQTRKRNIDSVLNLVNPKRLKHLNANQKKEPEKSTGTPKRKTGESTTKGSSKIKDKQQNVVNKSTKEGHLKQNSCDSRKLKSEISDGTKIESNPANKPFKKRPVLVEETSETVNKSDKKDVKNQGRPTQSEDASASSLLTVKVDSKTQGKNYVDKTETDGGKQSGNGFASKGTNTEIDPLKLEKNAVVGNEINVTKSARYYQDAANGVIELEPKSKTDLLKSKIELEPESDNEDDEFIDAGAVEDDMDADFVVPKKEWKENLTRPIQNSKVKIKPTDVIDVTNIKADGTENDALEKNSKYECVYCKKDFLTMHRLKKHLVMHTGAKPYKCEKCDMRFGLNTYLKRHMDTHLDDSEKPFACGSCPKRFSRKGLLDIHQISHQDVKPFTCPICFKKFKRKMTLQCHSKVHKHGKMYICQYCGKSFGFRSTLGAHILKHSDVKPYVCTECGKGYYTKQSFHDHTMRHKKIKEVECQICNRRYYNKKELRKHMPFHTNYSNFRCEPCKMFFKDAHCRRIHMVKAHKKDYSCDFCDEKFASLRNLKTHIFREHRELRNARRHKMPIHEKANFKHVLCDFCGKELSNKYRLKTHLLAKHSGMKRTRAPRDPNKVKGPVKTYPSGLKVLCTICNKVMYNKYKLYKHMEKMHDIPLDEISKIELVKLYDGISNDSDIELRERYGNDIDVQTIVIKPASANSNETENLSEQDVQFEGSTVHYVDSQGNILYTDSSNGKGFMNDYMKMEYDITESNQEVINASKNETSLIEMGRTNTVSLLAKGQSNLDFPRSIVDYAAKAAKIIDIGDADVSETSINLTKDKDKEIIVPSNMAVERSLSTTSTSNSQDITFIVQQATNRIAAHEQAENSRSLLNKHIACPTEDGIKLIVNDSANLEGVLEGYSDEGVKYIIEETVDENINVSDIGYVVKEDQSNVASDVVQTESFDPDQPPKIIIIDEQGEEQILSDQMKITYDPETGLYTYIVEEVVDQQGDENNTVQQISDNGDYKWVILDEGQITSESPPTTLEVTNLSTQSQANENDVVRTEQSDSVIYHQHTERLEHNAELLNQPDNKLVLDSGVPSLESTIPNQHSITVVSSDVKETHLVEETLTFNNSSESISHEYSVAKSIDKMPLHSHLVSNLGQNVTNVDAVSIEHEPANKGHSHHPIKSSEVNDTSLNVSELSAFMSPEIITSFNEVQTQEPKLFAGAVDSSQLTEPVASCSGAKGYQYSDLDTTSHLHLQHETVDTDTAMQVAVGDISSNTRMDVIGTDANHPIQTSESEMKTVFPQLGYSNNMLNLDASVTLQNEHDQSHRKDVNVIMDNVGQELGAVMTEDTESEISEVGNKKDLMQLENILKSGIREVSNTVEYSSFLDRMIDHLQSAKENVNAPEKEIQTEDITTS